VHSQASPAELSAAQSSPPPQLSPAPQPESSPQAGTAPEPLTQTPAGAPSSSQDQPSLPVYQFATGKSTAYHLTYKSISHADLRVLFEGQNAGQAQGSGLSYDLNATLESDMEVITTRVSAGRADNFYIFREPVVHLVVNGNEQTAQVDEVVGTLSRGFVGELSPTGKVMGLYLAPDAGKFSQDFARTLLAALQFILPDASPDKSGSWTTTEADRNGPYLARYQVTRSTGGGNPRLVSIRKTKLRYLPMPQSPSDEELPGKSQARKTVTPKMNFAARFDSTSGQLISLNGTETLETAVEDKRVAHSETTLRLSQRPALKLSLADTEQLARWAATLKENSSRLPLFAQPSRAEIEGNIQRTELRDATMDDLLTQLNAIKIDSNPDKQQAIETPLYLKFKAMIYLHPEESAKLGPVLARAEVSSPTFRIVSGALGAIGHREAQAALVQAITARPQDSTALASLIATLGGAPHPTVESEKAMHQVALNAPDLNVSGSAILALGSMARSLARTEAIRSNALVDFLLQRATAPGPSEQKQSALQSLGNSASPRALPVLIKLASDDSPATRAAAMDSLRNIPQPEVDPLLRHVLTADSEARVRLEAAFALGFRKTSVESFNLQKKVLATEGDDKVRSALLDNLAKMYKQFPEVRSILAHAAKQDPSEYVRKEAAGLLGRFPAATPSRK